MDIISKILNHESEIYNLYTSKRNLLIEKIKEIEINKLNKEQLLIFINDLKAILDPIKTSISSIDFFFANESFENKDNLNTYKDLLLFLILKTFSSESSDDNELKSDSELVSE